MSDLSLRFKLFILAVLCWAVFLLGAVFPDQFWATHFIAFLPPELKVMLLVASFALLSVPLFGWSLPGKTLESGGVSRRSPAIVVAVVMFLVFYAFPIQQDIYGDAIYHRDFAGKTITRLLDKNVSLAVSPDIFHPKTGERTVLNLVTLISYFTQVEVRTIFRVFDAFWGALFLFLWVRFVLRNVESPAHRLGLIVAGSTAPFLQLFFGHIEVYAPAIALNLAYWVLLLRYFQTEKTRYLWLLPLMLFLCLKFHPSAFLLVPSLLLVYGWHFLPSRRARRRFNWRWLSLVLLMPILLAGAAVYFFVLEDHVDPRTVNFDVESSERLFLPLFSPEPPLDRYNLLSLAHSFDYFNLIFLWSPLALYVLVLCGVLFRKVIDWNAPDVLVPLLSLLLYSGFFFMVNPLIGMPMDWDLFSLSAPLFLLCGAKCLSKLDPKPLGGAVLATSLAFALLTTPAFAVNADVDALSRRLESLGIRTYKTYWIRSVETINRAITLEGQTDPEPLLRQLAVVEKLEPFALPGNDLEYATLLGELGRRYLYAERDPATALSYLEEAIGYSADHAPPVAAGVEAQLLLGNYPEAHDLSLRLIDLAFPDRSNALKIALRCALKARRYDRAHEHADAYLKLNPGDRAILYIRENLQKGTNLEDLERVFTQRR
ncbi:MAG: hypothetical protein GTN89_01470 [Acidobacteria bacterium]|nr:hypothetical protein [Acidobacteriota bacterium]NIM61243.1 hypothetical protein [Acidobacteriota bacterium]NIO58048.1 hypothetical protein [Acidobacteriota bacterium]NIQ29059.1 hypothetical protein [Acidobacteriota bacterium]NIQ83587.1 hypothetical protein [Acidobacteriota bacterium]